MLILDDRDPDCSGIRYLSVQEILRLNNFPPKVMKFLQSQLTQGKISATMTYVANAIPTGMLHTDQCIANASRDIA